MQRYNAEKRGRKRALLEAVLGGRCYFCGHERTGTGGLCVHRKDGEDHVDFDYMPEDVHERELRSGAYVRLCLPCHRGVHWAMNFLGMAWDDVVAAVEVHKGHQ